MRALWKSDLGQGKHDPLEIVSVVTKSGSTISASLLVPLEPVSLEGALDNLGQIAANETAGLLEVIEAQMAAIDDLNLSIKTGILDAGIAKELSDLQEWADQFPDLIADLCVALGYAAHPVASTGIPELDKIVDLAR